MKILKALLWIIAIVVVIFLILCATGPKNFDHTTSLKMKASPASIFEETADYNKWQAWSPWKKMDPEMTNTITGNPAEVGHANEWDGKVVDKGKQWISEIVPDQMIKAGLMFGDQPDTNWAVMSFEAMGDSTNVTWTLDTPDFPFIVRGIMVVMGMSGGIAEDYKNGLAGLKKVVEAKPVVPQVDYAIVDISDTYYAGRMFKGVTPKDIDSSMFAKSYMEIGTYLGSQKMAPAGMPISIAHNYNPETMTMDLEIAMPTTAAVLANTSITSGVIPAGKCAQFVYTGAYEEMEKAWSDFMAAVMSKHKPRWSSYEVYVTDPDAEPDMSKRITHMMIPVE